MMNEYFYIKNHVSSKQMERLPIRELMVLIKMLEDYDTQMIGRKIDNFKELGEICTIGKLIEILTQDSEGRDIELSYMKMNWQVKITNSEPEKCGVFNSKELCDALWSAVMLMLKTEVLKKEKVLV